MASIGLSYTTPSINPTQNFIPINDGTLNFADSVMYYGGGRLVTKPAGVTKGLSLDFTANIYSIGDTNILQCGTGLPSKAFAVSGTGLTSVGSGGASGQHLIVQVNGTTYKIALDLP